MLVIRGNKGFFSQKSFKKKTNQILFYRGIIVKNNQVIPMSMDFTPESERERIKYLGLLKPELLGNEFTALEFIRRPTRKDLGI